MPSPFPGMDPYLERPVSWSAVHVGLIVTMQDLLAPALRPRRYTVRAEERVYLSEEDDPGRETRVPDLRVIRRPGRRTAVQSGGGLAITEPEPFLINETEEVHDHFIEIRSVEEQSVVTVIEVLSPTNKMSGSTGRQEFLAKRRQIYDTETHWMEIDLLRGGVRTGGLGRRVEDGYQVFVSRHEGKRAGRDEDADPRRRYRWRFGLRDRMPVVGVPLRNGEPDAALDLQAAFDRVYDRGGYDIDFDYAADPTPPVDPADADWARGLTAGLGR